MEKQSDIQPRKRVRSEGEEGPGPPSPTPWTVVVGRGASSSDAPSSLPQPLHTSPQQTEQNLIGRTTEKAPSIDMTSQAAGQIRQGCSLPLSNRAALIDLLNGVGPPLPPNRLSARGNEPLTPEPPASVPATAPSDGSAATLASTHTSGLQSGGQEPVANTEVATAPTSTSAQDSWLNPYGGACAGFGVSVGFGVTHNRIEPMSGAQVNQAAARLNQQLAASLTPQMAQLTSLQQSGLLGHHHHLGAWPSNSQQASPSSTPLPPETRRSSVASPSQHTLAFAFSPPQQPLSQQFPSDTLSCWRVPLGTSSSFSSLTPTFSQSPEVALASWVPSACQPSTAFVETQARQQLAGWMSGTSEQNQGQDPPHQGLGQSQQMDWAKMSPWVPVLHWGQYKGENDESSSQLMSQDADSKPSAAKEQQPSLEPSAAKGLPIQHNPPLSADDQKLPASTMEVEMPPTAEAKISAVATETLDPAQPPQAPAKSSQEQEGKPKPDPMNLQEFFADPEKFNSNAEILHCPINAEGDTVLYVAAKGGNAVAVDVLVRASVKTLDWQNHKGITALSVAAHKGRESIVRTLLGAGADVNIESNNGSTPLIQASHFGHRAVVQMVIEAGAAVDRPNNKGTTALMRAAQEGNLGVVEYLLTAGADVNRRNNERMTALMLGSQRGHAPVVAALLKNGAEVDAQTAQGSTALMLACKRGHVDVVHTLLAAGAEINMKDSRGRTARDTAARRQHQKILSLLQHDKQMRLMQAVVMRERSYLLVKLWHLVNMNRATLSTDSFSARMSLPTQILVKSLGLSQHLFHTIVQFMPLPRLWETTLVKLRRRCHIDPNEAIRGGLKIIDEILTDLLISRDQVQEMHLVRLAREESVARYLKEDLKMPELLFGWLTQESDVQSIMSRVERGVTFYPPIAKQVVAIASELHRWYKCHESSRVYSTDMTSSRNFFNVTVGDEDTNAQLNYMDEESSDDDGEE